MGTVAICAMVPNHYLCFRFYFIIRFYCFPYIEFFLFISIFSSLCTVVCSRYCGAMFPVMHLVVKIFVRKI